MSLPNSNEKPNLSQKTREEIKAEREAKKAAKTAAKAAKINKIDNTKNVAPATNCKIPIKDARADVAEKGNKIIETGNIKIKCKSAIVDCEILEKNTKANVAKDATVSSPTVLKENAIQSSNVQNASESKNEGKSKAELRAERRAKQEAQRAAKQQQLAKNNIKSEEFLKPRVETVSECPVKKSVVNNAVRENAHTVNLFKHLYQERERSLFNIATVNSNIHPAIVRLGVQYANKVIVGSNARCVALLAAIKQVIQDFEKPIHEDFIRGLEANLKESLKYLCHCRPLGVSMHNAMRHLTWQMTQFSSTLSDEKAKSKLQGIIDTYISEQIQLADKAISLTIQSKISDGNVILTYGYSSLIHKILVEAHAAGKQFRVVVVDGRPWLEGKEQLRRLAKHGIECSYILINALSFIMPEVSKVFLGAHAILANGAVMSRVGTAQVALMAKAFNVPVLVACETHKSSERVQTDSIVHNELGNADDLVNHQFNGNSKKSLLLNWRTRKSLNLLNITYDVTPADLVTAVVTELAILPCTSVPVILRIKPSEV
ncbi:Translation initiation factor eIF-2B subunit delta [Trachymyrmex septentrionalis]|uniref:Translation initiation factor eIF2B subunit delta n=1 Tax=Trachymyrmex septentrionalis TaxID=34720 RepID=A0A195FN29_9HYME|nr:PREDICTED: translation initiation factor eIF-2B subunit delta [Trachymyrmex septentrionalis]KYN41806.1 Translation initiation factor eIF-2B subunit delta [Trachymyrmex septentrionalis]